MIVWVRFCETGRQPIGFVLRGRLMEFEQRNDLGEDPEMTPPSQIFHHLGSFCGPRLMAFEQRTTWGVLEMTHPVPDLSTNHCVELVGATRSIPAGY